MKKFLILLVLVVGAFGAFVAFKMFQPIPDDLDLARTRPTDAQHFTVTMTPEDPDFSRNVVHKWILTIADQDGALVEDATVAIDGGMPQHGHGLPTSPAITGYLGDGQYRIDGVRFNMRGWWEFKLAISAGDVSDTITFNLVF